MGILPYQIKSLTNYFIGSIFFVISHVFEKFKTDIKWKKVRQQYVFKPVVKVTCLPMISFAVLVIQLDYTICPT